MRLYERRLAVTSRREAGVTGSTRTEGMSSEKLLQLP